jgi:DNA repair protein RadC
MRPFIWSLFLLPLKFMSNDNFFGGKMKDIKSLDKIDKPREKMKKRGVSALTNIELVSVLIGSGVKGKGVFKVSKEILEILEKNISNIDLEKLMNIDGVGMAKACKIIAAIELSKRFLMKKDITITKAEDVYKLVQDIGYKKQEYFIVITLDGANHFIHKRVVFIGTLNQSIVHPREVFSDAITDRAASVILVHNHPSGNLNPSEDDLKTTSRLVEAGKILGIKVLDHVIVSKEGYFSFEEKELL